MPEEVDPAYPDLRGLASEYLALQRLRRSGGLLSENNTLRYRAVRERLERVLHGQRAGGAFGPRVRGELRVPTSLRICFSDGRRRLLGESVNVSSDGLFVATEAPPSPGTRLQVEVEGDPAAPVIEAEARVVWRHLDRARDGRPRGMGIVLEDPEPRVRSALEGQVALALEAL